ncbi:MAG: GNAT family N-acetyltransferase [Candidatus Dormibacteraeota bacterium]|nr:GNAT family N-acetyltransferase [Candidatus Dormibacteraeota bacterium]MBV9526598.1 GNAT family N-acetyltransferase [Candidatus Dormibacteraeota bacterium]
MSAPAVRLVPVAVDDAVALHELLVRNREYLAPWSPARDEEWYGLEQQRERLAAAVAQHGEGSAYYFKIVAGDGAVGRLDLNNVVRGVWRNTNLGYWVAESERGRGHATAAVKAAVTFAFSEAGLHRVEAAVMPRNRASLRVVEKAGFRREGVAERYLRINGRWEQHVIHAITAEEAM